MTSIKHTPLISIVVPTYNRAKVIRETIESVIHQSYTHWELLIVDDGSEDETESIVKSISDDRIKYFKLPHTGYIGKVRNFGLRHSKGELIAFHDSDDLWVVGKLETQLSLLDKYPQACFVISNGDKFGEGSIPTPDYDQLFVGNLFLPILEHERFCFYSPTLLIKKDVLDEIGLLDESVPTNDIEFFFRMSHRFVGIFTNERLVRIRKHSQNTSDKFNTAAYMNNLKVLQSLLRDKCISGKTFRNVASRYYYKLGLEALREKRPQHAVGEFRRCFFVRPTYLKAYARFAQSVINTIPVIRSGADAR